MSFRKGSHSLENFLDSTQQKMTEEEIGMLASFPMLNPNPIIEADFDGNLLNSNPAAKKMFSDLEKRVSSTHYSLTGNK